MENSQFLPFLAAVKPGTGYPLSFFFWPSFSIVQLKLDREYDSISTIIGPKTSSSHMMRETCEFEMEMSRKA
jgi:hypothetical protein